MDKSREMMVYKHNDLVQKSRHSLSLAQQKAMIFICSLIKPDTDDMEYSFNISDYIKTCGIEKSGKAYEEIKDTLLELTNIGWYLPVNENGDEVTVHWLTKARTNKKSGKVSIRLDEDLAPFLLHIKNQTTRYELYNILALTSGYAIQLYEILKSYAWTGQWLVSTEEFKYKLMLNDIQTYSSWGKVKEKVIDIALKQINEYTDLNVLYKDNGGRGKKATMIAFVIKDKKVEDKNNTIKRIEKHLDNDNNETAITDDLYAFINKNKEKPTVKKSKEDEILQWQTSLDDVPIQSDYEKYTTLLRDNIDYSGFLEKYPDSQKQVDEIIEIMVDTLLSRNKTIKISGDIKSIDLVKNVFLKITFEHIEYIMMSLENNTTKVRNIKAYIIATIYNAPLTIDHYYSAEVKHDIYG